ncbi:anthranilate phosphoribosyltransferase [Exophiala dermatitidis]|uniref:Anthranilate phosphoribosyltransferase n=2 Tax=Exophiala dermatitidis TaxID=5970 RepID=H6BVD6_EXODN|nr:anthranilate phosphoribosyltransferase [Exophiala dermatitidis NIH/UT8656]KAJ4511486.1 anthranilate phosphoribosyltransferase [Exophiala dermatitidis]EHY55866.1 anthranilate phosphoribosyltransferase [Exophiala dermatitidis NIH/UT8656]KAJ4514250.1 anthranilate phosphoribosyltransferase [Exophiala dermatitidis]KAJ4515267.1 anthranilate phosphoribosyltransferase [Exophiala dermatitidis]KAJ4535329.1 anthranilate phosphoribosyltransferase [Exophiala dermatitidis]
MATPNPYVSIAPLLKKLSAPAPQDNHVDAEDIALAFSRTFENRLNGTQLASLLTLLHSTRNDRRPDVIAKCAEAMRDAAVQVDKQKLKKAVAKRRRKLGEYRGGLCDIVGTGGDAHSTFNISTTSSIIASPILLMAKHGNRAQTSMSGSADVLNAVTPRPPKLEALTAEHLPAAYEHTNYTFLFAPNYHPGMKHAATVRRELGLRTIFNLLGPLAHPVDASIEARVCGVAYQELGPTFAEALILSGATKAMVVCGQEDLDEISCAGKTNCWLLRESKNPQYEGNWDDEDEDATSDDEAPPKYITKVEKFEIEPADFGLPSHPLSEVGGGKLPRQNAEVLMSILRNERSPDDPILHFVLMNVAALFVVSGACEADTCESGPVIKERGPGGGRWKEGVKKARWCIESGKALEEFQKFIDFTNSL